MKNVNILSEAIKRDYEEKHRYIPSLTLEKNMKDFPHDDAYV
jgi:hypothetical protein